MKKIFILLYLFLSLSTLKAETIWQQVNPMPPLVDFNDVHFINTQEGWACGDEGVLIYTLDGAQTWNQVNTLLNDDISGVWFVDSQIGYICGEEVLKTEDGGNNWERILGHNQSSWFYSIYFLDEDIGFAGGNDGRFYRTEDGGVTWSDFHTSFSWFNEIFALDDQTIWAGNRYMLLHSTNGGEDWEQVIDFGYYKDVNDIYFLDDLNGWVTGDESLFYRTTDGGATWDSISDVPAGNVWAARFYNELSGFVYIGSDCYKAENGGLSLEKIESYPALNGPSRVTYPIDDFICVVGDQSINSSFDLGENWQIAQGGPSDNFNAVFIVDEDKIFTVGDNGLIYSSSDGGTSWTFQASGTDENINDVIFRTNTAVWIVGNNGFAAFSNDEGATWETTSIGTFQHLNAISFDGQKGMIVGQGIAFSTNNGGITWTNTSIPAFANLNDVELLSSSEACCVGNNGVIFRTDDFGETWEQIEAGTDFHLMDVCFVDEDFGWIAGNRVILSTTDGGNTWNVQWEVSYSQSVISIEFEDQQHGWACGRNGNAYHTKDGGITWVEQNFLLQKDIYDMSIYGSKAFCTGETGVIFKTDQIGYLAPFIKNQIGDTALCEGQTHEFFVDAIGDSLQYQWYKTDMPIQGETDPTFIIESPGIYEGGIYHCEVFNGAGWAKSNDIMLSVKPKAMVVSGPEDISAYDGDTVIFNQSVVGALPINYQWQKDGVDIPGAVFHTYTIYGVGPDDIGNYRCIVSNECNIDTSVVAVLEVSPGPGVAEDLVLPFSIYPNPAHDFIQIHFDKTQETAFYSLVNLEGEVMVSAEIKKENVFQIELNSLLSGVYVLKLIVSEKVYFVKFVKQ
ncbi:MAG: T9SS type A sorting domain-containing protein [Bacteroidales bacterium]|nr:T9SS type A sorting domain-containing protein [Bacteroidales bacterium]